MPDNLFQSEAESAKPLIRKELFCSHANRTHFHKEGFSLSFALKVSFGTRIWSIKVRVREDCLVPVVQTLDSAIQWINLYPVDSAIGFPNTYPLDSDLSDG